MSWEVGRMAAPEVWVAKDDGSDLVRAETIAAAGRDYTGTVTVRLSGGEGSVVTLVSVASHEGKHTPDDFHRQPIRVVAPHLPDAAGATVVRPVWDDHDWHWATEPL
jgi:hypothetical protein